MRIRKANTCVGLCLCLAFSISLLGQESRQQNTNESCRKFVGKFYAWYLGIYLTHTRSQSPTSDFALKAKPHLFSPDMVRQLREDSDAQKKAGSDLVSLDADPFLGTDGPFERYVVERITIKDGKCLAEVHGALDGKESKTPNVTSELVRENGRWRFVNFYFPGPSGPKEFNLLDGLKADREVLKKYGPGNDKRP